MENIICKIMGHKPYTRYDIRQNKGPWCWSCTYCERCYTVLATSEKNHEFIDVYPEIPCVWVTRCKNCGYELGEHSQHEFDLEHPVIEGCTKHHICTKCGAKSELQIHHQFSGQKIIEGCTAFMFCTRCGQRNSGTSAHDFRKTQDSGCVVFKVCSRCGDQKVLEVHHEFDLTSQQSNENTIAHYTTSSKTYTCKKCGEKKVETDEWYTDW
jgi:hypothetical protein